MMQDKENMISLRKYMAIGYAVIALLTGGIAFLYLCEWKEMEGLEEETNKMNRIRQKVHDSYALMLDLTLYGETILEWEATDTIIYKEKRMAMDSILCEFKKYYPPIRIDSVRQLLSEKERRLFNIWELYGMQGIQNERIASQVPVIAYQSSKETKKKGGLFGLFRKKKKQQAASTSSLLYTLNRDVVKRQQEQSHELSTNADSLAYKNSMLNIELQQLIRQLDEKVLTDLSIKEEVIKQNRERGYILITGATVFMLLLLICLYIIIHKETLQIKKYRRNTAELIRRQSTTLKENAELIDARQKMMHTITHELRTPLSAITGYADLLDGEDDAEKQKNYRTNIRNASERMVSQLNMLLNFFRLDNGKEEADIAPLRLTNIVETLESEFRKQAEDKELTFVVKNCDENIVFGDKPRLIQIGENLLSNALKFTKQGFILLSASYMDGVYKLCVEDSGSGFSKEEQNRVFKSFERLSNAATQDGFGLGLSIVKSIVELLGGTIEVESETGKGSRFTITIPMKLAGKDTEHPMKDRKMYPKRNYSVVAIDNNRPVLEMMKEIFAKYDVPCDTCTNVGELMELIRNKRYDLLITDLKMPGLNGYDVLDLLRDSNVNNSKSIPIIVTTASGCCTQTELQQRGFDGCLFKPFSIRELLETADRYVDKNTGTDDLPDFSSLIAYGNKVSMLDTLIEATKEDIEKTETAGKNCDMEQLDEMVHHLRSSWGVIRVDKPLWDLHELLHREDETDSARLQEAVNAVIEKGKCIIALAEKMRKEVADE
ncbi:hybrid sensor histidine kinase/response regulator [Bacteroides sp. 14(A)]|uniref:hybrid sensor histidine kinase/response regulator n=1 Tax=Bacteroides sp. 14(A) TaxID=1163670 RepID=UPI0004ADA0F5|nr:hybrid sensor histidine kinase/response regulator [Bacteroides sp. 14(A)]